MKVSVCGCSINSKYDVQLFVEFLNLQRNNVDLEIVITHDDRVNDGSNELFKQLANKHDNLKFVRNDHEQTVDYLRKLMDYYDRYNIFKEQFRRDLRGNVEKFAAKQLFNHDKSFLWLTSGVLYDMVVRASTGDLLIVTPADFVYGFSLSELVSYVKSKVSHGFFYAKPNAIWARINNQNYDWVVNHTQEIHDGKGFREGYRYDSRELFKDYLKTPPELHDTLLPDFRNNKVIRFSDPDALTQMRQFNIESMWPNSGVQYIPSFHGYHIMTRKTYDQIGGFTHEHQGRAFPDDKMTYLGQRSPPGNYQLASQFAVYWVGQYEVLPYHNYGYQPGWQDKLKEVDPYHETHPIPSVDQPTYLHAGLIDNSKMGELVNSTFNRSAPPVKII